MSVTRSEGRLPDQLRPFFLEPGFSPYAEGSCRAVMGGTEVLVTASVEDHVPRFLRNTGLGWVTAEYGMLPRATHERTDREAAKGKQTGRTQEIQRLIGRSLRAVVDRKAMGEIQIRLDCDVIRADGGTRCASITGAYVALYQAFSHLLTLEAIRKMPLQANVAAVSCALHQGIPVLDPDYFEDRDAGADANFVMDGHGRIIEIQCTAEGAPVEPGQFAAMLALAEKGIVDLITAQNVALMSAKT
ncbi:MAG: ribonuclease PH [Pseudomonadota bacterium]|nr:ribonuclease PH [Pseudomonadota bacterium]